MANAYGTTTVRMIELYMEDAESPMYLSGYFRTPPRNFHMSEEVTIDVEREDEDIAIVVQDLSAGTRKNESTLYTNKGFIPPIFNEEGTISSYNLLKRRRGRHPFEDPDAAADATEEAFRIFRKLERKIRRTIELMSSQVLQTATVTLRDAAGVALYTLDFQGKATHFPTVGTNWGASGATPLVDLEDLAQVLRRDGKRKPNRVSFGKNAWRNFIGDASVQEVLDNRRIALGTVMPESRGEGATFMGYIWIGEYQFEMWRYDGWYKDPQTGLLVPYIDDDNVIMTSDGARLDLTYGGIPRLKAPEESAMPFLPGRMSDSGQGLDLTTNAWFTPDGTQLKVSAGTRPLCIPTAIDTFGCLTTQVDS